MWTAAFTWCQYWSTPCSAHCNNPALRELYWKVLKNHLFVLSWKMSEPPSDQIASPSNKCYTELPFLSHHVRDKRPISTKSCCCCPVCCIWTQLVEFAGLRRTFIGITVIAASRPKFRRTGWVATQCIAQVINIAKGEGAVVVKIPADFSCTWKIRRG